MLDIRLVIGVVLTLIVVSSLGVRRFSWRNVLLIGGGFVLFQVAFAQAFEERFEAPVLVLLGALAGSLMQIGVGAEKQLERERATQSGG